MFYECLKTTSIVLVTERMSNEKECFYGVCLQMLWLILNDKKETTIRDFSTIYTIEVICKDYA